ncbi:hypothetical protein TEA_007633 [Camellia sinensis var. sinensis]|uniref:Transmembrane protein n=1 Tax=Camellia sinensis var. sinensis TaxID=542762 RepID=A0A4S4DSX4_CAMSN|nr:hypothetical protein TEA_007633 [Camellia sinensis var. sinensis]
MVNPCSISIPIIKTPLLFSLLFTSFIAFASATNSVTLGCGYWLLSCGLGCWTVVTAVGCCVVTLAVTGCCDCFALSKRQCEICGETAKNVTGTVDDRFMEKWSELRPTDDNGVTNSADRVGQRGRRCCNFLIICTLCGVLLFWSFHYKEKLQ